MANKYAGTQTEKNLWEAFAGESQARNKYTYFASVAKKEGYEQICDELWYVYASDEVRRRRLRETRGYSDEKTESIMQNQLSDDMFRRYASVVIDNSGTLEESFKQIEGVING